jgi:hypothetical protein
LIKGPANQSFHRTWTALPDFGVSARRLTLFVSRDMKLHHRMYREEENHTLLYLAYSRQYLREACCRCADDGV